MRGFHRILSHPTAEEEAGALLLRKKIRMGGAQFLDLPRPQNQGTETLICTLGRSARTALLSFASWELCEQSQATPSAAAAGLCEKQAPHVHVNRLIRDGSLVPVSSAYCTVQRGKADREDDDDGMAPGQSSPIITIQRPGWCDHAPISSGLMIGANDEPKSDHRQRHAPTPGSRLAQGCWVVVLAGGLPPCATRSRVGKAAKQRLQLMLRCEPSLAPVRSSTCTYDCSASASMARDNGKTSSSPSLPSESANNIVGGLVIQASSCSAIVPTRRSLMPRARDPAEGMSSLAIFFIGASAAHPPRLGYGSRRGNEQIQWTI